MSKKKDIKIEGLQNRVKYLEQELDRIRTFTFNISEYQNWDTDRFKMIYEVISGIIKKYYQRNVDYFNKEFHFEELFK
jgi:hypothetical protein|tara:strand:+ start:671 stop:904 length:234 start_codon:yes stop_codon:yes gene_type:complete